MNALVLTWSRFPRVLQWAALALVLIALYFLAIEPVLNLTGYFRTNADRIAGAIQREKDLASPDSEDGRLLSSAARVFGRPVHPGDPAARPDTLYRTVNRILREHFVEDAVVNERQGPVPQLRPELLALLTGGLHSIEKYTLEVAFESDPQTATSVLAAMESAPEITAVGRVRIEKGAARYGASGSDHAVRVMLAPEIWVYSVAAPAANSGGSGVAP